MKRYIYLLILAIFLVSGCAEKKSQEKVIATINNYKMTTDDFNYESSEVFRMGKMIGEVPVTKKEMLDALITKEVLIQEAVRENLDKDKAFMKAIELYWEQALLKNLLTKKSEEISQTIVVYDDDIKGYYDKMKNKIRAKVIIFSDEKSARKGMERNSATLEAWEKEPEKHSIESIIPPRWYILGENRSPVEYYVFIVDAKKGEGIVKINGKWTLIEIEEITPNEIGPLLSLKEKIIKDIRAIKEKEAMEKWIDTLRLKSRIKIDEKTFNSLN